MEECYNKSQITTIRCIYVLFIIIWIVTIYFFSIYKLPYSILLVIPILLFLVALINAPKLSEDVESEMSKIIYLPVVIIVAVNVITWTHKESMDNLRQITICIIISIVFILISSFDLWVNKCWIFAYRHVQSAFETMSVSLIIFAIIVYGVSFKLS